MNRKCQNSTIYAAVGSACFLCGLITTAFWWKLYNGIVLKHLPLSDNSEMFRLWTGTDVPLFVNVYLFNWTNAEMTIEYGDKPELEQVGPYVYRLEMYRKDFVWNDNDTLTYSTGQRFHYVPELSPENPDEDFVTVPDLLLIGMKYKLETDPPTSGLIRNSISLLSENVDPSKVFVRKTVSELLFDGYENSLLTYLDGVKSSIESVANLSLSTEEFVSPKVEEFNAWASPLASNVSEIFSSFIPWSVKNVSENWVNFVNDSIQGGADDAKTLYKELKEVPKRFPGLVAINNTRENTVNINAGNLDLRKFGLVNDCNFRREYPVRGVGSCGRVNRSSLGEFWPVDTAEGRSASLFVPDLCGSLRLENVGQQVVNGIEGVRFESKNSIFDDNESGVGNLSTCLKVPLFASLPHFYAADTEFLDAVSGLTPDENLHAVHLTFHKDYGVLIDGSIRLQINVKLQNITIARPIRRVPDVVLPILWFETNIILPTSVADKLHFSFVTVPLVFKTSGYSLLVLGILILVFTKYCLS